MKTPMDARRILSIIRSTLVILSMGALVSVTPERSHAQGTYPTGPDIRDRYATGAISIRLADAFVAPKSSTGNSATTAQIARLNFIRSEPADGLASQRFFTNDMNGRLMIVDRATGLFSTYLDFDSIFNGVGTGDFDADPGYAAGLVTMQFDPAYASNGKFYTVHTEVLPGGTSYRQAVLSEWQDADVTDAVFSGTTAELLRVQYGGGIHPMGDISFNPAATEPTHPDFRAMYITSGDGGSGESAGATRLSPQRLDTLVGKVLRIRPDGQSVTGTYAIPRDNPFVDVAAPANPAVFALGLRNPHRLTWDTDPNGVTRGFIADIGLHAYEEVNLLTPGANYGYSSIEGDQVLGGANNVTSATLPATLPLRIDGTATAGDRAPTYPLALYSHRDGDAIAGGFVYRGSSIPALHGTYVFGDIANGRLFFTDVDEMLAADDGDPFTTAAIHELNIFYDDPTTVAGVESRRVFDVVRDRWDLRNETPKGSNAFAGLDDGDPLPGSAASTGQHDPYGVPYGGGRADIRLGEIDGELYLISKSDGMIRRITNAIGDATFDGMVNLNDLQVLASHYRGTGSFADGDFDLSGLVDFDDLRLLASHYRRLGHGDITPDAVAGLDGILRADWTFAVEADLSPLPSRVTIDVAAGVASQAAAAYPRLYGDAHIAKTGTGTLVLDQVNTLKGVVTVEEGTLRIDTRDALTAGTIRPLAGGTFALGAGLRGSIGGLDPLAGGLTDVGSTLIHVRGGLTGPSVEAAIRAGMGDGSWNGTSGITSSAAAGDAALGMARTVGWIDEGNGSLTIGYAAPGDANLDWTIDLLDVGGFLAADRFDADGASTWADGDNTHDGRVDLLDVSLFLSTGLFDTGPYASLAQPLAAVPEPALVASLIPALIAASMALRPAGRHRRRAVRG